MQLQVLKLLVLLTIIAVDGNGAVHDRLAISMKTAKMGDRS